MPTVPTIQLSEVCRLLDVDYREVRYILEEGHVPKGVAERPSTGNRREFAPEQAFWLGIVLKLKQAGVKTPLSAKIADAVVAGLRTLTQNLCWDPTFLPMKGWFETDHQYFLDVADRQYMRLVTDSNPSRQGLYEFPWEPISGRGQRRQDLVPFVFVRMNITQIASVFARVDGWKCPDRR